MSFITLDNDIKICSGETSDDYLQELRRLLDTTLMHNCFQFNQKQYKQKIA
jgi:hypothetical protein